MDLKDSEGAALPLDENGRSLFSASISTYTDGTPELIVFVPLRLECMDSDGNISGTYHSAGVLYAPMKDVLEEYLKLLEAGEGLGQEEEFATWLIEFAGRLTEVSKAAAA